jgi:hypothetical protein
MIKVYKINGMKDEADATGLRITVGRLSGVKAIKVRTYYAKKYLF